MTTRGPGPADPGEPVDYRLAHLHEALMADPLAAEQGVELHVAGGRLFVTGTVATERQRVAIARICADAAPDLELCNDVEVLDDEGRRHAVPEQL